MSQLTAKTKKDEKDEVNNDEDAGEARQAASGDANADHKDEPEVNNKEEKATTDGGSKAPATTTADSKADAEPPVAKENALAGAGDSVSAPVATKPPEEVAA
uniref:Triadin n=1 Tax=Rhipicephalus zambeziensis TaxID=60191 RepID=A0A224ZA84_9ACAR